MRLRALGAGALAALALSLSSCSDGGLVEPSLRPDLPSLQRAAASDTVWITEFHYDNGGTDVDEFVEVSGPAGTDFTGWSIVLYNGNGGSVYDTDPLPAGSAAPCGSGLVLAVLSYPSNGIQNGAPDAIALVDPSGAVRDFVSYEGELTAANGPAAGLTAPDIGVAEPGNEMGTSLQRASDGTWQAPRPATKGACNEEPVPPGEIVTVVVEPSAPLALVGGTVSLSAAGFDAEGRAAATSFTWASADEAVATVDASTGVATGHAAGEVLISATAANGVRGEVTLRVARPGSGAGDTAWINEIHYDNAGTDAGEAIEVAAPAGTDLAGWSLVLYNGSNGKAYDTSPLPASVTATCGSEELVLAVVTYPSNGIQNGPPDAIALVDAAQRVVDFRSYEGVLVAADGPAAGLTSVDIGTSQTNAEEGTSLQRTPLRWTRSLPATFGACNVEPGPPGEPARIWVTTKGSPSVAPAGFVMPAFADAVDGYGEEIPGFDFTWSSSDPSVATVDDRGYISALREGTATITAAASNGKMGSRVFTVAPADAPTSALYRDHVALGVAADADPSDDVLIRRDQYVLSYNPERGVLNWAAWNLNASHITTGANIRCECYTPDPALLADGLLAATDLDYLGSGYSRGHMVQSFNRTTTLQENARTYYLTNIAPQAAANNTGPWGSFENFLTDRARAGKELYIVAGGDFSATPRTLKDEGRVQIPEFTWKIAVVLDGGEGLDDIDSRDDLEVYAIRTPNTLENTVGISNDWTRYAVTVDLVEELTGYDFLDALPDLVERFVERGATNAAPVAATAAAYELLQGETLTATGAASTDADGDPLAFAWDFGDGASASGASVTHLYAGPGVYTVTLTVSDPYGGSDVATATVTVKSPAQAVDDLAAEVRALAGGVDAGSLLAKLEAARKSLEKGNGTPAANQLGAFRNEVAAWARSGRLSAADAERLAAAAERIVRSIRS